MSKFARAYHLGKEIQKIYKDGVLKKLFFDWKKYIGEEINIEYARGYCSNRININGKVYQNLASKLYIGAGNTLLPMKTKALEPNGYANIKLPYALKPNTSYTIVIDVVQPSEEHAFQLRNAKMEYLTLTIPALTNKLIKGKNVATFTTSSNEISAILIKNAQTSTKDLIIKNTVIVIEGDLSGETIIEENIKYLEEGTFKPENMVIEGKTYQNLLTNKINYTFSGSEFYYDKTTLNNGARYTRNDKEITSGVNGSYITFKCHTVASLLKSSTTYTLAFNIESTFSDYKGITVSGENDCYFKNSKAEANKTRYFHDESFDLSTGYKKIMFETNSNITKYFGFGFPPMQSQSEGTFIKITNIILLEGDYTNIDLPTSINGIESVGEGEFVKSKNLYNKKFMNSTMTTNGEVVDSRGFTFTLNDECTFKINGTNTTGCTIMSENILDLLEDGKSYILSTNLLYFMATITYNDDTPQKWTSAFTVNKSVMNSIRLYNQWKDTDIVSYNNFVVKNQIEEGTTATDYEPFYEYYPVTIRNYNHKCETDGIVLPNGVKNSIDTIDGKKVHVQRVKKIVLDGSNASNFKQVNTMQVFRWEYFFDTKEFVSGLCDNLPIKNVQALSNENKGIRLSGISFKSIDIKFPNNTGFDINTFRTWLSENPVTVWYELETPIYTYLESGLYDDITIPTSNIKNEIYLENGKWYHKRNIGKVIFDGSSDENWFYENGTHTKRFITSDIKDAKYEKTRTPVCIEGYTFKTVVDADMLAFLSGVAARGNTLYIYNYAYTSVKDFRAYLAKNPLEVYYELAEPVISELYFTDITYKLNEPLRSLPNDTCDTIENGKLVQRVGKVVLDGSNDEKWIYHTSLSNDVVSLFYLGFHSVSSERLLGISDRLPCDTIVNRRLNISKGIECFYLGDGTSSLIQLQILNSKLNSLDKNGVLAYLQANHITIYYPLATPIETEITPDKMLINGEVITDTADIKLPNGTKDIIEEGYYIKRVGKVTYNGQEDWKTAQANTNVLVFYLNNTNFKELSSLICDTYTVGATSKDKTITCGNAWRPQIRDGSCSTVEEFKQLLAKNPITVWYELATPVKIPLFVIKEGLTTIKSMNNITPQIELDCLVRDKFQNMCPNTWVNGDISVDSGVEYSSSSSRVKLKDYIAVQPNTTYYCDTFSETVYSGAGKIGARYYKKDKTYISGGGIGIAKTSYRKFTTPNDCYYIKFIVETLDINYKMYLRPVKEMN